MMSHRLGISWYLTLVLSLASLAVCNNDLQHRCQQIGTSPYLTQNGNITVTVLNYYTNGTNITLPDNDRSCTRYGQVLYRGDICRLAMHTATSPSSEITLEAWFPANWNGRFLSTGNGGISGCIQYEDIAYGTALGFATVGANNGHNGTNGTAFYQAPEVVRDYVYRSVVTGIIVGKELTTSFYSQDIFKSYYLGCSTGGRQGMKIAQDFPDLVDGIVAGAPAFDFNNLINWSLQLSKLSGFDNTTASFITRAKWAIVNREVLRQCDAIDGAQDGIIEDPDTCYPKYSTLICPPDTTNTTTCLTAEQVARVEQIFSPLLTLNATVAYPRLQPGAEVNAVNFLFTGRPFPYSVDWYRYALYNDPNWDPNTFSAEDIYRSNQINPYNVSTWKDDLSAFQASGGKLITYHGLVDPLISSENSGRYYRRLANGMALPPSDLDDFYRYFRIAGMNHCTGGTGAWNFGQRYIGQSLATADAENNVVLAMMKWVENGTAPDFMRGYKYLNDSGVNPILFSRKHCKYPTRNVYKGPANYTDENAWECV